MSEGMIGAADELQDVPGFKATVTVLTLMYPGRVDGSLRSTTSILPGWPSAPFSLRMRPFMMASFEMRNTVITRDRIPPGGLQE